MPSSGLRVGAEASRFRSRSHPSTYSVEGSIRPDRRPEEALASIELDDREPILADSVIFPSTDHWHLKQLSRNPKRRAAKEKRRRHPLSGERCAN